MLKPMDAVTALSLQVAWGADEALDMAPLDRLSGVPPLSQTAPPLPGPNTSRIAAAATLAPPGGPARPRRTGTAPTQALAQAADLAGLEAALSAFEGFPLKATAGSSILGSGPVTARIMLILDAPRADDDRAGRPLAGPEGTYFTRMLDSVDLPLDTMRVGLLVPWRPPGGRPPSAAEIRACLPILHRHIALVGPTLLVPLGTVAARAVMNSTDSLRKLRGRWRQVGVPGLAQPVQCLPMQSPEAPMAAPACRKEAWADLLCLRLAYDEMSVTLSR